MNFFRDASLKHKLEAIILVTVTAVLLLSVSLYVFAEFYTSKNKVFTKLNEVAGLMSANSAQALATRDRDKAVLILKTLSIREDVLTARILDIDGRVFAGYFAPEKNLASFADSNSRNKILPHTFLVTLPVQLESKIIGSFELVGDLSTIRGSLYQKLWLSLGVLLTAMILGFILSSRLQKIISEPIKNG